MAKITTEYDTQSKGMKVHVDGKELKNVMGVSHYCTSHDNHGRPYESNADNNDDYDTADRKYNMGCMMAEHDKEHKISTHTHLMCSASKEADEARAKQEGVIQVIDKELIVACAKKKVD